MSEPQTPDDPAPERRAHHDRRAGNDRRQQDGSPPSSYERRHAIEPRLPDVSELALTPEELEALGFIHAPRDTAL